MPIIIEGQMVIDQRKVEAHLGHHLTAATYGDPPVNLAIECMDCYEVVGDIDLDRPRLLPCGCRTQSEHDEGQAMQANLRKAYKVTRSACIGCYLGDDAPSMHSCYIHRG